jgi:signal transduction histidine kinase
LCDVQVGGLTLYDGEHLHPVAIRGRTPQFAKWFAENPIKPSSSSGSRSRMIAEKRPIHILDYRESPGYREGNPVAVALVDLDGIRTSLSVPMLKAGRLVGGIIIQRREVRPFTQKQIDLIGTFASQAVIAIENVRLFKEIQDKSVQLEIASRHKSEFLASMSHELRTPLNAILGFNEMIIHGLYGEVPPDMKVPLDDVQSSGKHLLRLINNVLDLAKIEAGRIMQCLFNLAGNALKFTKAGKVEIAARHHDGMLTCCVSDTGVGIAADKIGSLFTEFKQTDATIASEYGGTGLGLSISKQFIEMHGGRIWVESEVGLGSRFSFEIPLRAAVPANTEANA